MATDSDQREAVITRVPLSEARARLGALVEGVRGGEKYVVLERSGEPVAVLVDIDEFEDLMELGDPEVQRLIRESRADELAGRLRPARELLAELRAEEEAEALERERLG
jgi:prevent-host-death family protein